MSKSLGKIVPFLFLVIALAIASFTRPNFSFASDSLTKVLQSVFWIENGFSDQGIYYPGKDIDPNYNFFYFKHSYNLQINKNGSLIAPFPFLNTILITPFVYLHWQSGIVYLGAFLFWLNSFLIYRITKRWWIFLVILFFTPLLQHYLAFSDIAFASIFLSFFLTTFFKKPDFSFLSAVSVLFAIFSLFLRTEVLLLYILLFMIQLYLLFRNKAKVKRYVGNVHRLYVISLILFVYVATNYLVYDSILGPRFDNNKTGIFRLELDVIQKWKSLLFWGNARLGLLGYSPWLIILCVLYFFFHPERKTSIEKKLFLIWLVLVVIVTFLSPNDSNIDWGTRYYTCFSIFPILLLSHFKWKRIVGIKKSILLFFLCIGLLYSAYINFKVWKEMKNISVQIGELVNNLGEDPADVYVVEDPAIANSLGVLHIRSSIFYGNPTEVVSKLSDQLKGKRVRFLLFPMANLAKESDPFWKEISKDANCIFPPLNLKKISMFSALCKL
ncbi:hypothetical protein NUH30_01055 [Leptospira sp. 85282-16]|uniref:LA_3751/LA_3752 family putative glycosyltransferase n=1 Tax=Leptospira sp. 85282-16 TaxID=2971256 RepID=UPI0021BF429C|nr:hypothetical protein [Leptospira sp. 85282-16]MCT8332251.1 hypothetical protein [Leptospira sp. 85282-16]